MLFVAQFRVFFGQFCFITSILRFSSALNFLAQILPILWNFNENHQKILQILCLVASSSTWFCFIFLGKFFKFFPKIWNSVLFVIQVPFYLEIDQFFHGKMAVSANSVLSLHCILSNKFCKFCCIADNTTFQDLKIRHCQNRDQNNKRLYKADIGVVDWLSTA